MRICIVGDPEDLSATYVAWLAQRRSIEVIELREDELGADWVFAFHDGNTREGHIERAGTRYQFSTLHGAFVRLNPQPLPTPGLNLPPEEKSALIVERRNSVLYFLNSLPCKVVNRPSSGRSNGSKPYQMHLLANSGFQVPKWIVSNEEPAIRKFAQTCRDGVVYKSCSGIRSKVRLLDDEVLQRMQAGATPIVAQEFIKGSDVRIHVVGSHIFPTEVISNGIDYRFEGQSNEFRPTMAPRYIQELCCNFAKAEGSVIAGFDFRVSEEGNWYCLEMNPVPTFLPYEMATGQPIGNALLDVFVKDI